MYCFSASYDLHSVRMASSSFNMVYQPVSNHVSSVSPVVHASRHLGVASLDKFRRSSRFLSSSQMDHYLCYQGCWYSIFILIRLIFQDLVV